jgi:hypothetical protein
LRRISERDDVARTQPFGGFLNGAVIRAHCGSIGRRISG